MDSTSTANALDSLQGFLEFLGENGDLVVLEAFGRTGRQEPDKRSAVEKCLAKAVSSECVPLQTIDTFLAIVIPTAYPPSNQNAEVSRELQKSCRYLLKSYSRRMFECTLSLKFKFRLKKTAKRFRSLSTTQQQRKIVDVIRDVCNSLKDDCLVCPSLWHVARAAHILVDIQATSFSCKTLLLDYVVNGICQDLENIKINPLDRKLYKLVTTSLRSEGNGDLLGPIADELGKSVSHPNARIPVTQRQAEESSQPERTSTKRGLRHPSSSHSKSRTIVKIRRSSENSNSRQELACSTENGLKPRDERGVRKAYSGPLAKQCEDECLPESGDIEGLHSEELNSGDTWEGNHLSVKYTIVPNVVELGQAVAAVWPEVLDWCLMRGVENISGHSLASKLPSGIKALFDTAQVVGQAQEKSSCGKKVVGGAAFAASSNIAALSAFTFTYIDPNEQVALHWSMKPPAQWTTSDVGEWLRANDMPNLRDLFKHMDVDGQALIYSSKGSKLHSLARRVDLSEQFTKAVEKVKADSAIYYRDGFADSEFASTEQQIQFLKHMLVRGSQANTASKEIQSGGAVGTHTRRKSSHLSPRSRSLHSSRSAPVTPDPSISSSPKARKSGRENSISGKVASAPPSATPTLRVSTWEEITLPSPNLPTNRTVIPLPLAGPARRARMMGKS